MNYLQVKKKLGGKECLLFTKKFLPLPRPYEKHMQRPTSIKEAKLIVSIYRWDHKTKIRTEITSKTASLLKFIEFGMPLKQSVTRYKQITDIFSFIRLSISRKCDL